MTPLPDTPRRRIPIDHENGRLSKMLTSTFEPFGSHVNDLADDTWLIHARAQLRLHVIPHCGHTPTCTKCPPKPRTEQSSCRVAALCSRVLLVHPLVRLRLRTIDFPVLELFCEFPDVRLCSFVRLIDGNVPRNKLLG